MSRQVRLDDDVADQLEKVAARAGGQSLSSAANTWLRRALGMRHTNGAAPKAGAATAQVYGAPTKCSHPVGRRIGDRCAQCGATVAGARR